MHPTRYFLNHPPPQRARLWKAVLWACPRPKVAAGILAFMVMQLLGAFGVEFAPFGWNRATVEAVIAFVVMWAWRDPFSLPLHKLPLSEAATPGKKAA